MNHNRHANLDGDIVVNLQVTIPTTAVTTIADRIAAAIVFELKAALAQLAAVQAPELPPVSIPPAVRSLETSDRLAYSFREAANLMGVSYHSILRLTQRGLIKPSSALRKKLISKQELQRFLNLTKP
jgi:hypothetical protein